MASEQTIFAKLESVIKDQEKLIKSLTEKLEQLQIGIGGGSGSASIEDFTTNTKYKRNVLVVDTDTETVYRVIADYTSTSVQEDCAAGFLKLVGFESQIVTLGHEPSQKEIDSLPDNSLVAIYSATDTPYKPPTSGY